MTPVETEGMFDRAEKAGLAPFGANRQEMHFVEHPADFKNVDNWWQQAWNTAGVDKLLALIAASY